jgi:hypothetical protein
MARISPRAVWCISFLSAFTTVTASAHVEADGLIVTAGGSTVVHIWQATVTGSFDVPLDDQVGPFDVTFLDPDSVLFVPGPAGVTWLESFLSPPGIAEYDSLGAWSFALEGLDIGSATIRLRIWFQDHFDYTSPAIPLEVNEMLDVGSAPAITVPSLGIAPNPARGRSVISYVMGEPGPVELRIHDVSGRLVGRLADLPERVGRHTVSFDATRLPAGVYVVELRTRAGVAHEKLQLLR